jgi:hypothetical protein
VHRRRAAFEPKRKGLEQLDALIRRTLPGFEPLVIHDTLRRRAARLSAQDGGRSASAFWPSPPAPAAP